MRFHVTIFWNDELVLDGNMTGVLALSLAQDMADNFNGETRAIAYAQIPDYGELDAVTETARIEFGDATGKAVITFRPRNVQ